MMASQDRLGHVPVRAVLLPGRRRLCRREGGRNRLKRQIARMLSGRDSNYYYHLSATGIALPRMITRGGQRDAPRVSFRFWGPYDESRPSFPHLNAIWTASGAQSYLSRLPLNIT